MKESLWIVIGLAAAASAGGCKSNPSVEGTPATSHAANAPVAKNDAKNDAKNNAPMGSKTAATNAGTPFEGEIRLEVSEPSLASDPFGPRRVYQEIAYDVKGDKVRLQPVNADPKVARVVGNRTEKTATAVVDADKTYTTVELASTAALPPVTRTGKIEQVLGRACEDWTINDGGERIEMCVAKGIAYLDPLAGRGEPAWAAVLTREHAFPLRVVATLKDGSQEFRAEATRIEARSLDDSLFKVPTDYKATSGKAVQLASIP